MKQLRGLYAQTFFTFRPILVQYYMFLVKQINLLMTEYVETYVARVNVDKICLLIIYNI